MSELPPDHQARLELARLSLEGLSLGDAFGEKFFRPRVELHAWLSERELPPGPWHWTDDTAMALSIVEVLTARGCIDQDELAEAFARRYKREPERGYGSGAHHILSAIGYGLPWQEVSQDAFGGLGSYGNGGAMRAAPIGGYFADDPVRAANEALLSAQVTHAHPEGPAGAAAVAAAAALARAGRDCWAEVAPGFLAEVARLTPPDTLTRQGIEQAAELEEDTALLAAVMLLGNGAGVSSQDTVPFCLWCVSRFGGSSFEEALWHTVSALGDRDTTCAIVGGIVALMREPEDLPEEWRARREALSL